MTAARIRQAALAALMLAEAGGPAWGQAPPREEQFVYTATAFTGKHYTPTFAGEESDAIYLIADVDNFLTARYTFVYFWPITRQWLTDQRGLNVPVPGSLQVTGPGREPLTVRMIDYTYYNVRGEYELNWRVATGDAAHRIYREHLAEQRAYRDAAFAFQGAQAAYQERLSELMMQGRELRHRGADTGELEALVRALEEPQPPQRPATYVVPPAAVRPAIILNLSPGRYRIRLLTEDGLTVEGSERTVIAFAPRRAAAVGLEVIPGDKWTRPVESNAPSAVLYVDGSADLYLRPFFQIEYNDHRYARMLRNDAKGNRALMRWVRTQQIPRARIDLTRRDGSGAARAPETRLEEPFFVAQTAGAARGYRIVPFDPAGDHANRQPSLRAVHVPLAPSDRVVQVQVRDARNAALPTGARQIRVVDPARTGPISLALPALPLLLMAVVLGRRARRYRQAA